jgi:hypothetical protein
MSALTEDRTWRCASLNIKRGAAASTQLAGYP